LLECLLTLDRFCQDWVILNVLGRRNVVDRGEISPAPDFFDHGADKSLVLPVPPSRVGHGFFLE
jgi:hypothetical protein